MSLEENIRNIRYETISMEYLYAGLVLQEDICSSGGNLLVAKGVTLTETMIERLRNLTDSKDSIRVSAKLREELLARGTPQKFKQQYLENRTGYTKVTGETKKLITIAQVTNHVPYDQVCDIGDLVLDRIKITDPALLFQCINGNNEIDEYLFRHSTNVAIINGLMGKWLGLDTIEIENLVILGLVHDIGKTRIPSDILNSPNKLSFEEFEVVKKHTVHSYDMLNANKNFSDLIKKAALHHHEKMNGTGYPDHLMTDDIPFFSKITSISDIYDAMVSQRCYKIAQSPFRVLRQMQTEQFSGLDMKLVNLFNEQMPQELIGKSTLMSNGAIGIVRHINDNNIEFPIVDINGETVMTNNYLYCISMIIDDNEAI